MGEEKKITEGLVSKDVHNALKQDVQKTNNLMMGVVFVLLVFVATLLINYFSATQATFQDLKDQVVHQNAKIDGMSDKIDDLRNALDRQVKQ